MRAVEEMAQSNVDRSETRYDAVPVRLEASRSRLTNTKRHVQSEKETKGAVMLAQDCVGDGDLTMVMSASRSGLVLQTLR